MTLPLGDERRGIAKVASILEDKLTAVTGSFVVIIEDTLFHIWETYRVLAFNSILCEGLTSYRLPPLLLL